jgi:hypothetical protein
MVNKTNVKLQLENGKTKFLNIKRIKLFNSQEPQEEIAAITYMSV